MLEPHLAQCLLASGARETSHPQALFMNHQISYFIKDVYCRKLCSSHITIAWHWLYQGPHIRPTLPNLDGVRVSSLSTKALHVSWSTLYLWSLKVCEMWRKSLREPLDTWDLATSHALKTTICTHHSNGLLTVASVERWPLLGAGAGPALHVPKSCTQSLGVF
jgi:hypothetical protein